MKLKASKTQNGFLTLILNPINGEKEEGSERVDELIK